MTISQRHAADAGAPGPPGKTASVARLIRRWPASSLVMLAFVITYLLGLPLLPVLGPVEASLGLREEWLSLLIMRWGPTLAGFAVLAAVAGRAGFSVWLTQLLRWRVSPRHYLFIYAAAPAVFAASILLSFAFVQPPPQPFAGLAPATDIAVHYIGEIAYITVNNGEETGWRFVLLGLLLSRMRLFSATLIVAVVWSFWHLPMFLLSGDGLPMFAPFVFNLLGLSIILSWLYKATDSLLLPILFHGAVNATTYTFQHHWVRLSETLDALGPFGEWMYAVAVAPVALTVLCLNRPLFFGPPAFRQGEDWARRHCLGPQAS